MKSNELASQEIAAILSPHALYGGTESLKYPYLITRDISPSRAVLEVFKFFSIGRMPGDRTLLSLDASHAILTRVLRFEDSGRARAWSRRRDAKHYRPIELE
jgi:hypothetical protein